MVHVRRIVVVALIFLPIAHLMRAETLTSSDAVAISTKLGASTFKAYLEHETMNVPPSGLSPEERSSVVEDALARYQTAKNLYSGVSTGTKMLKAVSVAGFGVATVYTGGTLPVLLLAAGSSASLDMTNLWVERRGKETAGLLLAAMSKDLMAETKLTTSDLLSDPKRIRETILGNERLLKDVKDRAKATGDQKLLDVALDAIEAFAANEDAAKFDVLVKTAGNVADLDTRFADFVEATSKSNKRIEEQLKTQQNLIEDVQSDVQSLSDKVAVIDGKVDKLGANQDLVVDFMFSSASPADKAQALRSGLLDRRIVCPDDARDCNRDDVKTALIDRYDTEARIQTNVTAAGKVLSGINDVSKIASDLNINIGPDGQKALEITSAALSAYTAFETGNPLGAISSITGIFGKKSNPDAERFSVMMGYLREQFAIINQQLKVIQENQKKIFDAILDLSKQLQATYEHLDGRLNRMETEQQKISDNVKQLIWAPWQSCYSVYFYALQQKSVDPNTLQFSDFDDLRSVVNARAPQAIECMNTVTVALDRLTSHSGFGNFLDLSVSLSPASVAADVDLSKDTQDEAEKWNSFETAFRNSVADPATRIAERWAARNNLSSQTLFYLLASDIYSLDDLEQVRKQIADHSLPIDCATGDQRFQIVRRLICLPGEGSTMIAKRHVESVLSTDVMLDVIDWMTVVAQLGNIYQKDPPTFAKSLPEVANLPKDYNAGQEIITRMVDASTLALASQYRIYGQVTALGAAEDIAQGRTDQDILTALDANPYLATNTLMILLHIKRGVPDLQKAISGPQFEQRYLQALSYAGQDSLTRFEPLYALFGRDLVFGLDDLGLPSVVLTAAGKTVSVRLPAPTQLAEGRLLYPPSVLALRAKKEVLVDRTLDYQFGSQTSLMLTVLEQ